LNTNAASDYAIVNQGQLKNLVVAAVAEMDANLPSSNGTGAGATLHSLTASWTNPSTNTSDYGAVTLGQLKNAVQPMYDRLAAVTYTNAYPWISTPAGSPSDFNLANIGQTKALFDFDLSAPTNQVPAWWATYYFGTTNLTVTATAPVSNGLTILQCYQQKVIPTPGWYTNFTTAQRGVIYKHQWSSAQAANYAAMQAANTNLPTTGLTAWFKASGTNSGVTLGTNGSVSGWSDLVTGKFSVSNTNASQQPAFVTNALNGLPVVRFKASQQQGLANSSVSPDPGLNGAMTMITVASTTNNSALQYAASFGVWGTVGVRRALGYNQGLQFMDASGSYGAQYTQGVYAADNGTSTVEAWTLDSSRTNVVFYRNGSATVTKTLSGVGNLGSGFYLGEASVAIYPWQGDIAEVLVYDHQLSTSEMAAVTAYLSGKYGTFATNAPWLAAYTPAQQATIIQHQWNATQAASYVAMQASRSNLPTTGLTAWFKADGTNNGITLGTHGAVSGWSDLVTGKFSVSNTNASQQPAFVNNGLNGLPVVRFKASQLQGLANGSVSPDPGLNGAITMIAVGSTTNNSAQQFSISMGSPGAAGVRRALGYYQGLQLVDVQSTYVQGAYAADNGASSVEAWTLDSSKTNVVFFRNGAVASAKTLGAGVANLSSGFYLGESSVGGSTWQGDIAEVLIYDHQLSTSEMAAVTTYLSGKYGTFATNAPWLSAYTPAQQATIVQHQWNATQAASYVAMQASNSNLPTTGLTAWFKADGTNSGVSLGTNGSVSGWSDLVTGKFSVSNTNVTQQPAFVTNALNGFPVVRFNGAQLQGLANVSTSPDPALNGAMTVIAVGSTTNNAATQYSASFGAPGAVGMRRALGYSGKVQFMDVQNSYAQGINAADNGYSTVEAWTLDSSKTNVVHYRNGSVTATKPLSGALNLSSGFYLGESSVGGSTWQGDIAEVLVYDHQLSSSEMGVVTAYLSGKYGTFATNAPWLAAYTPAQQATIIQHQWNATQAASYAAIQAANTNLPTTGLTAWFKADGTNNGITLGTNGSVSGWSDLVTGKFSVSNTNVSQQPAFVTNALNGLPVVRFNAAQQQGLANGSVSPDPGLNGAMTMVAVALTTNNLAQQYTASFGVWGTTGVRRAIGYNQGFQFMDTGGSSGAQFTLGTNASSNGAYSLEGWTLDSSRTNVVLFRNGAVTATKTLSGVGNLSAGFNLGQAPVAGYTWQGDIAEVLVYDHQLSSDEMVQLSAYISAKYNFKVTVPAPVLSPLSGASNATSVTVTMTGYAPPMEIHYTTDGSLPTATSPLYTGPLSLTQSTVINAAIFINGGMVSPVTTAQYYVSDSLGIGISDAWQIKYFGSVGITPNALAPGGSGLTNLQAYLWGYDPTKYSSNGDGLSDYVNHLLGYAGNNFDINGNGLTNAQDIELGLNPFTPNNNFTTAPPPDPSDQTVPVITLSLPTGAVKTN
jgi:hypothetical protein